MGAGLGIAGLTRRQARSWIERGGRFFVDEARHDVHHGIELPPANADAHRSACRRLGGARPIAICASRAAIVFSEASVSLRTDLAQRRNVGHRVESWLIVHAHTRRRTAATGSCRIAHNVNAIAIAACP